MHIDILHAAMPRAVRKGTLQINSEVGRIGIPENIPSDSVLDYRLPNFAHSDFILAHIIVGVGESRLDFVVADPHDVPTLLTIASHALFKLLVFQLFPIIL